MVIFCSLSVSLILNWPLHCKSLGTSFCFSLSFDLQYTAVFLVFLESPRIFAIFDIQYLTNFPHIDFLILFPLIFRASSVMPVACRSKNPMNSSLCNVFLMLEGSAATEIWNCSGVCWLLVPFKGMFFVHQRRLPYLGRLVHAFN